MAAIIQLPEGGELPVYIGLQSERAMPQILPGALVQDHQVHQPAALLEQEVEGNVVSCQVVHANEPGVLPSDLEDLHTPFLSCLNQVSLKRTKQESYYMVVTIQ